MTKQGGEETTTINKPNGRKTENIYQRVQNGISSELHRQFDAAKEQDWWTFSKMWVVVSVYLIIFSGAILTAGQIISLISSQDLPVLISLASMLVTLGPYLLPLFIIAFLAAILAGVSVATGKKEVWIFENKRQRYIVHIGKLIVAITLLIGYQQYILSEAGGGLFKFVVVMLLITGLLLLPFSLILWGAFGIYRERSGS